MIGSSTSCGWNDSDIKAKSFIAFLDEHPDALKMPAAVTPPGIPVYNNEYCNLGLVSDVIESHNPISLLNPFKLLDILITDAPGQLVVYLAEWSRAYLTLCQLQANPWIVEFQLDPTDPAPAFEQAEYCEDPVYSDEHGNKFHCASSNQGMRITKAPSLTRIGGSNAKDAHGTGVWRVAGYARTSAADRLNKEVSSLDVQLEIIRNCAKTTYAGRELEFAEYIDGGFSGKDGNRPAYEQLKLDVDAGLINAVFVYKVDRIGRNITEFVNFMVFLKDRGVAFKSATEAFDSTTPEGELMMNLIALLADYFLKITRSRILDSVASAKARGKWTQGRPIFGYDLDPKTHGLVVNPKEAEGIRLMFSRFLQTGSAKRVARELNEHGYTTKAWTPKPRPDGTPARARVAKPITSWHVLRWLASPVYAGLIYHARLDATYEGEHEAIVDRELFDKVQKILNVDRNQRQGKNRSCVKGLLKDIAVCGYCSSKMRPTYANANKGKLKNNYRYMYYLCAGAAKRGYPTCDIKTIPAQELERVVTEHLVALFQAPEVYAPTIRAAQRIRQEQIDGLENQRRELQQILAGAEPKPGAKPVTPDDCSKQLAEVEEQLRQVRATFFEEQDLITALREFEPIWDNLDLDERMRVAQLMLDKVVVFPDGLDLYIRQNGLTTIAKELLSGRSDLLPGSSDSALAPEVREVSEIILIHVPIELKRVNGKRRMRTARDAQVQAEQWPQHEALVLGLARGHAWAELLKSGECQTVGEVSKLADVDPSYIGRMLKLTLLAPDIQEAILNGKEPASLSLDRLRKGFPMDWELQRKTLGFEPVAKREDKEAGEGSE